MSEYKVTIEENGEVVLEHTGYAKNQTDALYQALEKREADYTRSVIVHDGNDDRMIVDEYDVNLPVGNGPPLQRSERKPTRLRNSEKDDRSLEGWADIIERSANQTRI